MISFLSNNKKSNVKSDQSQQQFLHCTKLSTNHFHTHRIYNSGILCNYKNIPNSGHLNTFNFNSENYNSHN